MGNLLCCSGSSELSSLSHRTGIQSTSEYKKALQDIELITIKTNTIQQIITIPEQINSLIQSLRIISFSSPNPSIPSEIFDLTDIPTGSSGLFYAKHRPVLIILCQALEYYIDSYFIKPQTTNITIFSKLSQLISKIVLNPSNNQQFLEKQTITLLLATLNPNNYSDTTIIFDNNHVLFIQNSLSIINNLILYNRDARIIFNAAGIKQLILESICYYSTQQITDSSNFYEYHSNIQRILISLCSIIPTIVGTDYSNQYEFAHLGYCDELIALLQLFTDYSPPTLHNKNKTNNNNNNNSTSSEQSIYTDLQCELIIEIFSAINSLIQQLDNSGQAEAISKNNAQKFIVLGLMFIVIHLNNNSNLFQRIPLQLRYNQMKFHTVLQQISNINTLNVNRYSAQNDEKSNNNNINNNNNNNNININTNINLSRYSIKITPEHQSQIQLENSQQNPFDEAVINAIVQNSLTKNSSSTLITEELSTNGLQSVQFSNQSQNETLT